MEKDRKWKAGAGMAEIEYPACFFPEEGFFRIHDPIHARVLILEEEERFVIVSLELPSLRPYTLIDEMKRVVREAVGVNDKNIWICVTHDLAAPHVPDREAKREKFEIHIQAVKKAIREACTAAAGKMEPVRVYTGTGVSDINVNRDMETADGWWQGINPDGTADKLVSVVRFAGLDGKTVSVLYHYAVKSSTLEGAVMPDGSRYVTGDVTGAASRRIEEKLEAPAIFFMGAAGDQEPKYQAEFDRVDEAGNLVHVNLGLEGFRFTEELGGILAADVLRILESMKCTEESRMRIAHRVLWLPGQQFYQGGKPYHPEKDYKFIPSEDEKLIIEVLQLGSTVFLGLQPEATAAVGLKLREMNPGCLPLLVAMVNGGKDYLSDETAYERMTFGAIHSVFARGAAELFLEYATKLLKEL